MVDCYRYYGENEPKDCQNGKMFLMCLSENLGRVTSKLLEVLEKVGRVSKASGIGYFFYGIVGSDE